MSRRSKFRKFLTDQTHYNQSSLKKEIERKDIEEEHYRWRCVSKACNIDKTDYRWRYVSNACNRRSRCVRVCVDVASGTKNNRGKNRDARKLAGRCDSPRLNNMNDWLTILKCSITFGYIKDDGSGDVAMRVVVVVIESGSENDNGSCVVLVVE